MRTRPRIITTFYLPVYPHGAAASVNFISDWILRGRVFKAVASGAGDVAGPAVYSLTDYLQHGVLSGQQLVADRF